MTKQRRKLKLVYRDDKILILGTEDKTYAEATIKVDNAHSGSVRDNK